MEDKWIKIYQLVLRGEYYNHSGCESLFEDFNIFTEIELITDEYIEKVKNKLTDNDENYMRWNYQVPIQKYIRTYNLVSEEEDIIY